MRVSRLLAAALAFLWAVAAHAETTFPTPWPKL